MKVLGIDTSTKSSSIALIDGENTLFEYTLTGLVSHSEKIIDMLDEAFEKFEFKLKDVDLIAVGVGPGSFTGIRIGLTIAKVMAQSLEKDIVGVSSLKALSIREYGFVMSLADAKRDRVYVSIVENTENFKTILEDSMLDIEDVIEISKDYENLILTGVDSKLFYDRFKNARLARNLQLSAREIAILGLVKFKKMGSDNFYKLVPNYLKLSQAEKQYEDKKSK